MNPSEIAQKLLEGADRIAELATELSEKQLAKSYAPGKWTAQQLISHNADVDLVFLERFFRAIAEPGSAIIPFDHDVWVDKLQESSRPVEISIGLITATREAMAHSLRTLPAEVLKNAGKRSNGETQSALAMAEKLVNHLNHHAEQIEAIRDNRTWTKKA